MALDLFTHITDQNIALHEAECLRSLLVHSCPTNSFLCWVKIPVFMVQLLLRTNHWLL